PIFQVIQHPLGKLTGLVVQNAEGAQGMTIECIDRAARVEVNTVLAANDWIIDEALVLGRIRHDHHTLLKDGMATEGNFPGQLPDSQAILGLEPLPLRIEQGYQ